MNRDLPCGCIQGEDGDLVLICRVHSAGYAQIQKRCKVLEEEVKPYVQDPLAGALQERDDAIDLLEMEIARLRAAIEDAPCPVGGELRPSFVKGKLTIYCDDCERLSSVGCWKREALKEA